jgi:general L-amino acid transport system substrate-binding protein
VDLLRAADGGKFVTGQMLEISLPQSRTAAHSRRQTPTARQAGTGIGLDEEWVVHIVKAVSGIMRNLRERNVGMSTPLKIARGKNALWNKGGPQYAPPIR